MKTKNEIDLQKQLDRALKDYDELEEELTSANESITWWKNRFNAVERDYVHYKTRLDKAIEYLESFDIDYLSSTREHFLIDVIECALEILSGDSNE